MDNFPLVTIIATCFNHGHYLLDCLQGIISQTYPNIQLIITDDCSTDNSVDLLEEWINSHQINCKFIRHQVNIGLNKTLNEALNLADGKYIAHISTDDIWLPEFIKAYVQELESRSQEYGLVYGNSFVIDESGQELPRFRKRPEYHPEGHVLFDLIKETFLTSQAVIMKKKYLERVGNYNESLIYEDFDIWTKLAEVCLFAYCPEILSKFRYVKSSLSNSNRLEMAKSTIKILERIESKYPETRPDIEKRKVDISKELYILGYKKTDKYLWKYYLKHKSRRNFIFFISSFLGIKYNSMKRFLN